MNRPSIACALLGLLMCSCSEELTDEAEEEARQIEAVLMKSFQDHQRTLEDELNELLDSGEAKLQIKGRTVKRFDANFLLGGRIDIVYIFDEPVKFPGIGTAYKSATLVEGDSGLEWKRQMDYVLEPEGD